MATVGVIGCGNHSVRSHIEPIAGTGFSLAGVFDPDSEQAQAALTAANSTAPMFDRVEDLLADPSIDAVLIASPDEFHPEQLALAVAAGKHVLVEKPLATTVPGLDIAREALAAAERAGLVVSSCFIRRCDPPYLWIKDRLAELIDQYGELIHIELDFSYHEPVAAWKNTRSLLLDHFPHEVDLIRWLLGDTSFHATKLRDEYDSYCVAGIAGSADTGVSFLCMGTRKLSSTIYPEEVRLRFARGRLGLNTKTGHVSHYDQETQSYSEARVEATDYERRAAAVTQNFAAAIERQDSCYVSSSEILLNTESSIALLEHGHFEYVATT